MGVDTNINIGPFLKIKGTKKETVECNVVTCLNKECKNHKIDLGEKQKFCSECGGNVGPFKYNQKIVLDPYDLTAEEAYENEFIDELCHAFEENDFHYFIPNQKTPFDNKRGIIEEYDDGLVDLTEYNSKEEIEWFKKKYKKIIDFFHKELGEKCLEVRWGIIQWFS